MLTLQMPMLLALLGTALMAVVIFAPSRIPAPPTISFAPPPTPSAVERTTERWELPPALDALDVWEPPPSREPTWPLEIDARAAGCDTSGRLDLVQALATLRSPWAETILRRALAEEANSDVRAAAAAALET